jgi:hypothetical protein
MLIRKESVTCCGCSGGDFIHCMNTPNDLITFLLALTPQKPCKSQNNNDIEDDEKFKLTEVREKWFSALVKCYNEEKGWIADPEPIIASMTDEIWFSCGQPLIRFSLTMQGTLCEFLSQQIFSDRLHAVLSWWYQNEATAEEKENYMPLLKRTVKEMSVEAITQAINLYNHGTYELTGQYNS